MSLFDRLVPASALRWGRLTDEREGIDEFLAAHFPWLYEEPPVRPDPAALWGEADRRAEDR